MKLINNHRGQAEIMDGLILMLIVATASIVLLSVAANYGVKPIEIYEENYADKLAQNTLLSMYHITYVEDPTSQLYRKSIMVGVSQRLSLNDPDLSGTEVEGILTKILTRFKNELGWEFLFALRDDTYAFVDESIISTEPGIVDMATLDEYSGNRNCATAALTYPEGASGCDPGTPAGDMCYMLFTVCTWRV